MLSVEPDADALARGELQARLLGVPVRGLRVSIYVVADLLARPIVAPRQLPVGALIGVPLFLWLMRRQSAG